MLARSDTSLAGRARNGRVERVEDALRRRRRLPGSRRRPRAGRRTRRRRTGRRCRPRARCREARARPRRSSWSPAAWPRLSLTVLKSSRSRKTTADGRCVARGAGQRVRDAVGEQRAVRQAGHGRRGTPGGRAAASNALRSLTSRALSTMPADVLVVEQVGGEDLELGAHRRRRGAARTRAAGSALAGRGHGRRSARSRSRSPAIAGSSKARRRPRRRCSRGCARSTGSGS